MTTLVNDGRTVVVRCDDCRRLWPIAAEHLDSSSWSRDDELDLHRCPLCVEQLGGVTGSGTSRS